MKSAKTFDATNKKWQSFQACRQSEHPAFWPISVVAKTLGLGRATVYLRIQQKLFPKPVKIGHPSRWPSNEVLEIQAAYLAGQSDDEIRALVRQIMQDRLVSV